MNTTPLKILFLAAEAEPFVRVGGLGDVAGALPKAIRAVRGDGDNSSDIRLVIPLHAAIQQQSFDLQQVAAFSIPHRKGPLQAKALFTEIDGLPVYLIGGPPFSENATVYSPDTAIDGYKYTFFSLAALQLARQLDWSPHIVHANDWHTAPAIYALAKEDDPFFAGSATLLGLHNLPYLGVGAGEALAGFGLPPTRDPALPAWARHLPLPLGILHADHVVAVSPTYAKEIRTGEFGSGLEKFLRSRAKKISGILNGIDVERWDPAQDPLIARNFSLDSVEDRLANKRALQEVFKLEQDERLPLLAMVTRIDPQKGVDLVLEALAQIRHKAWQAIILGSGDAALEEGLRRLESDFPDHVRVVLRFDSVLSHQIYAGADMLLMPSRYEPCGLAQMIAMRYGCLPVARATGGLRDTINDDRQPATSSGFLFAKASSPALAGALRRALRIYSSRREWRAMQHNGMRQDFSWNQSAQKYLELYRNIIRK